MPVRLARSRADALARWLSGVEIPQGTILGDAGIPAAEIEARDLRNQAALNHLREILAPKRTGRPRQPVATYYLPVNGLLLLNDWRAVLTLPRRLRPILWRIHKEIRAKHRDHFAEVRRMNLANDKYEAETVRKYRRLLRHPLPRKGNGLFTFKPDDRDGQRAMILNPVPLMILPQFHAR